jgi:hypothetical protein
MGRIYCLIIGLLLAAASPAARSDEIARWVDGNGVTQFGHPQFAPAEGHEPVHVRPTNGMVVPEVPRAAPASSRPSVVTLERPKMENRKGFRGFNQRPSAGQRNRRR